MTASMFNSDILLVVSIGVTMFSCSMLDEPLSHALLTFLEI